MTRLSGGLLAVGIAGLLVTQAVRAEDSIKGQVVIKGRRCPKRELTPATE